MTAVEPVLAFGAWKNNAELVADAARLGYLRDDWFTLDPTYGLGRFWKVWRPSRLVACDLDPAKSPLLRSVDFTALPWPKYTFDAVTFDPPYKLNGRSTEAVDSQYGVAGKYVPADARHDLMRRGQAECLRVLKPGGFLLSKCQDQVVSGKVRWQTRMMADHAEAHGAELVDRMDLRSYRAQPPGRTQKHARRNHSTLLVFRKASL